MPLNMLLWIVSAYLLSFLCYLPMLLVRMGAALPEFLLGARYFFILVPFLVSAVFLVKEHALKTYWGRCFKRISAEEGFLCLTVVIIGALTALGYSAQTGAGLFRETYSSVLAFAASCIYLFAAALLEEAAWRGFFFKRIAADGKELGAALLTGAIWGGWHIPMWTIRNSAGLAEVVLLFIWAVLISAVLGTVYGKFENLLSAALLHMVFNVCWLAPVMCNDIILFMAVIIYFVYRKTQKGNKEYTQ